jgi:hypothetical protein
VFVIWADIFFYTCFTLYFSPRLLRDKGESNFFSLFVSFFLCSLLCPLPILICVPFSFHIHLCALSSFLFPLSPLFGIFKYYRFLIRLSLSCLHPLTLILQHFFPTRPFRQFSSYMLVTADVSSCFARIPAVTLWVSPCRDSNELLFKCWLYLRSPCSCVPVGLVCVVLWQDTGPQWFDC